jgi:hypothetical protein
MSATDDLIKRLAGDAPAVRRLWSPTARAALWLLAVGIGGGLVVAVLADVGMFLERASSPRQAVELAATLATGILAIVAAFQLALPDRSAAWVWLPLPTAALWLATSGWGCVANWIAGVPSEISESVECLEIMIAASLPLGGAALVALYRARPLAPTRVSATAGLGVAALAAFLLQFFHPFDVTVVDLAFHAAGVALIVAASAASGRVAAA